MTGDDSSRAERDFVEDTYSNMQCSVTERYYDNLDNNPENTWKRNDQSARDEMVDVSVIPFDNLHIHRFCNVFPVKLRKDQKVDDTHGSKGDRKQSYSWSIGLPFVEYRLEIFPFEKGIDEYHSDEIQFLPCRGESNYESKSLSVFGGLTRTALQFTPFIIATVMLMLVIFAELSPRVEGISVFFFSISPTVIIAGSGSLLMWGILLWLIVGAGLISARDIMEAITVYGLICLLGIGTAVSVYLVLTASDPRSLSPNIIYISGYLLLTLLGGMFIYDGMLRTEYLFNNLEQNLIVEDETIYNKYKKQIAENLRDTTYIPVVGNLPTYLLFAIVLVSQFTGIWLITDGPQHLDLTITLVVNVIFNIVMAIIYFQMFVLINCFHNLITGNVRLDPDNEVNGSGMSDDKTHDLISYHPFHPDGYGGFRDFGRFATRVNGLLLLGGLYVIYRLYIQGARAFPESGIGLTTQPTLEILLWGVSYVGPVAVLIFIAFAWLYFSFWNIHVKMSGEMEVHYTNLLQKKQKENAEECIGSIEDGKMFKDTRKQAPVWPIDTKMLISSLSSGVLPLVLALPRFLF